MRAVFLVRPITRWPDHPILDLTRNARQNKRPRSPEAFGYLLVLPPWNRLRAVAVRVPGRLGRGRGLLISWSSVLIHATRNTALLCARLVSSTVALHRVVVLHAGGLLLRKIGNAVLQ